MTPGGWNLLFLQIRRSLGQCHDLPQAQLIGLVCGDGPAHNQCWSQERSYFFCFMWVHSSWNLYVPIQHTGEAQRIISEPPNKSKVLPKAPNAAVCEGVLGYALRADVQQSALKGSELLGADTIKTESQQFLWTACCCGVCILIDGSLLLPNLFAQWPNVYIGY